MAARTVGEEVLYYAKSAYRHSNGRCRSQDVLRALRLFNQLTGGHMDVGRPDSIVCQGAERGIQIIDTWTIRVHGKLVTNLDVGRNCEDGCSFPANTKL